MATLEDAQIPGQLTVDDCIRKAEDELRSSVRESEIHSENSEALVFTNVTPRGIEVAYSPSPRRHYKVRQAPTYENRGEVFWVEVPSVTSVLGVLDKPLAWWGMTVGVQGVLELIEEKVIVGAPNGVFHLMKDTGGWAGPLSSEMVTSLLTEHKKTVNHTLTKAGDRGTSVHDAFEEFCLNGTVPHPEVYPESEQPYIVGLRKFLVDWSQGDPDLAQPDDLQAEIMVGSLAHKFAGRYDMRCKWGGGPMVVKTYPKKANKVEELPAGRVMIDLKTSSNCYPSHALQLAAYELASVECGYEPTDYRVVVRVTKTGEYEVRRTNATADDFLAVRRVYEVMQRKMLS